MKIIGLAGSHASGKDTVAHYLEDQGFCHISTSDIVRDEAMKQYGSIERPVLYKTANEIRQTRGHGALSEMALERFDAVKDQFQGLVVSGFRAMAEAQVIKDAGGTIIFTDAPEQVRFERLRERARVEGGTLSFEEFKKREEIENGGVDPAFDISAIKTIADTVIVNDSDKEKFLDQIKQLLSQSWRILKTWKSL